MKRNKKMVLVSHCLLNVNAKVHGIATVPAASIKLITSILEAGYGIIQLPCVEQSVCGIRRWGQVKEQLDYPHFRESCRKQLTPILHQVKDFINNGYEIAAVIGLDGSPSCGVNFTCSGNWSGEMDEVYGMSEKIKTLRELSEPGVMMEVFKEILEEQHINLKFIAVNEIAPDECIENIVNEIC